MKKFSRILVVLAVLSMAIGLMTGCGNKKSEKSDNQSYVEKIFCETVGKYNIVSLILSGFIYISERRFITEYTDLDLTVLLDLFYRRLIITFF